MNTLYRFWGDDDELLYVGITCNPAMRFASHQQEKQWWNKVKRITLEELNSREELLTAERSAIRIEHPRYNIVHNRKTINANYRLDTMGMFYIDCEQPCDHPHPCVPIVLAIYPDDTCELVGVGGHRQWTVVAFHASGCPGANGDSPSWLYGNVIHRSVADLPTGIRRRCTKPNAVHHVSLPPEQITFWRGHKGDVSPLRVGENG